MGLLLVLFVRRALRWAPLCGFAMVRVDCGPRGLAQLEPAMWEAYFEGAGKQVYIDKLVYNM